MRCRVKLDMFLYVHMSVVNQTDVFYRLPVFMCAFVLYFVQSFLMVFFFFFYFKNKAMSASTVVFPARALGAGLYRWCLRGSRLDLSGTNGSCVLVEIRSGYG